MPPITPNSKVAFTIGALFTFTSSVIYGTWQLADARNQIMNTNARIEKKLDDVIASQWTRTEHERFAFKLERSNREIKLVVPDVNDRS